MFPPISKPCPLIFQKAENATEFMAVYFLHFREKALQTLSPRPCPRVLSLCIHSSSAGMDCCICRPHLHTCSTWLCMAVRSKTFRQEKAWRKKQAEGSQGIFRWKRRRYNYLRSFTGRFPSSLPLERLVAFVGFQP